MGTVILDGICVAALAFMALFLWKLRREVCRIPIGLFLKVCDSEGSATHDDSPKESGRLHVPEALPVQPEFR